jgi:hypothetical protein
LAKLSIGQNLKTKKKFVTCPDCNGEGRIRVLLADYTPVSIACEACTCSVFEGPTGKVSYYERTPGVSIETITGIELQAGKALYRTDKCYFMEEEHFFQKQEEAHEAAKALAISENEKDKKRISEKEKPYKKWAWNASYHRKCIRESERNIAYHKSKLAVASLKAKEDKKPSDQE